jgi:hypothetical protein
MESADLWLGLMGTVIEVVFMHVVSLCLAVVLDSAAIQLRRIQHGGIQEGGGRIPVWRVRRCGFDACGICDGNVGHARITSDAGAIGAVRRAGVGAGRGRVRKLDQLLAASGQQR